MLNSMSIIGVAGSSVLVEYQICHDLYVIGIIIGSYSDVYITENQIREVFKHKLASYMCLESAELKALEKIVTPYL